MTSSAAGLVARGDFRSVEADLLHIVSANSTTNYDSTVSTGYMRGTPERSGSETFLSLFIGWHPTEGVLMFNFLHRGGSNEAGQHDSTPSLPILRRKKTREEVQSDLLENLRKASRKKLEQKGIYVGHDVELDEALHQLAGLLFQESYGYLYNDNSTVCRPPRLAPNGTVACLRKSRSMRAEDVSRTLESYIRTLIPQANLHGEIQERATQDLVTVSRAALNDPLSSGMNWNDHPYSRTLEFIPAEDPDGRRNSIQVDGILVYCSARLEEDGHDVSLCILYYMAVYYEVTSELMRKRTEFRDDAIASAKEFANCSFRLSNETDLKRALERHGQTLFKMKFGFEYSDGKPEDLAMNLRALDVKRHFALFSSNKSSEEWFFELSKQYLDALPLQEEDSTIKKLAMNRLSQTLVEFAENAAEGQWDSKPFDRVHEAPSTPTQMRFSGFVFYYCRKGKTNRNRDVSLTYIFVLGVWYESTAELK